jgi:hypothetical protein
MTSQTLLAVLPERSLEILTESPCCGYHPSWPAATEPTALAAMALLAHGEWPAAQQALDWLADIQGSDGGIGIDAQRADPQWPTGWAVIAWQAALRLSPNSNTAGAAAPVSKDTLQRWATAAQRAVFWIRTRSGTVSRRRNNVGHDTQLRGWPWVVGTHSWVEPTAINLLALKASGHGKGSRAREAVELLLDRTLPEGGLNYGNTTVFGNTLRPHIQPTGLTLAAFYGETAAADKVSKSVAYLERVLSGRTSAASLSYALLGAAVHGTRFGAAEQWLTSAARLALEGQTSSYKLALLELAALGADCPWFVGQENSESLRNSSGSKTPEV